MPVDFAALSAALIRRLRERRRWTRGQAARRLEASAAVLYNIETARSRAPLSFFFKMMTACRHDPATTLGAHLQSVKELREISGASLVRDFRSRLKLTQRALALALGYRASAMIHHFEKGLREPALDDLLALMVLADDDARGFVLALSGDEALAKLLPTGMATARREWIEYWQTPHAAGVRQLMRTTVYRSLTEPLSNEAFALALGIEPAAVAQAMEVLTGLGVVKTEDGMPRVDPNTSIVVPRDVPRDVLDRFKASWIESTEARYLRAAGDPAALCSVDLIPVNREIFTTIVERIRSLQDEIHNMELRRTDGFVSLGWLASYVPLTPA